MLHSESVPGWRKKLYVFFEEWLSAEPVINVTTSGSTGKPKELRVSKQNMIRSACRTGNALGLRPGDKTILCLPVDYIAGKMMVVRAFVLGLDLIPLNPTSDPLLNFSDGADFAALTPMQVYRTLERTKGKDQLNRIKTLIVGGADLDEKLLQNLQDLKNIVYHTYGMTETLTHVALRRLNGSTPDPCFTAIPGVFFSTDSRDCLVIHDPALGNDVLETKDYGELISPTLFKFR
jgi:O-succinylbenzoic acid--CoA ligase